MNRVCSHCQSNKVNRPRGLCWGCYYTPGVKEMYGGTSKFRSVGVGHGNGGYAMPTPTPHRPGTPEKQAVLAERAAAGLRLWHPDDASE